LVATGLTVPVRVRLQRYGPACHFEETDSYAIAPDGYQVTATANGGQSGGVMAGSQLVKARDWINDRLRLTLDHLL
jgi:hypothetical protein